MPEIVLAVAFFLLFLLFLALYLRQTRKNRLINLQLLEVLSKKHSLSSKYGKITEQFMPFMESYPYNESNFRFIGTPIDGIQFEDDKIVLIEFKSSDSKLSKRQKQIKYLVNQKKVEFEEIRIK